MTVDPALAALLGAFDDGDAFDVAQARAGLDAFARSVGAGAPRCRTRTSRSRASRCGGTCRPGPPAGRSWSGSTAAAG
jgi:hypothetical protein